MLGDFSTAAFRKITTDAGDISAASISNRTGLDTGRITRLRNGIRQPSLRTAVLIAMAYDVSLDDLVVRDDDLFGTAIAA